MRKHSSILVALLFGRAVNGFGLHPYSHQPRDKSVSPLPTLETSSLSPFNEPSKEEFSIDVLSKTNSDTDDWSIVAASAAASAFVVWTLSTTMAIEPAHAAVSVDIPGDISHLVDSATAIHSLSDDPFSSSTLITADGGGGTAAAVDWSAILQKAGKKALGGGKAGASAAVVQVLALMWLRTCMNYQYRFGGTFQEALNSLWEEGGLTRLYQGLPFALVQGPLTRFGDTAANVGILALLESQTSIPLPLQTLCGSLAAGSWRIFLMPLDASKTAMQVQGADGLSQLWGRFQENGPGSLYQGALAQAAATAAGHFPWFLTYNFLNAKLPPVPDNDLLVTLIRAASVGMAASCVSDCVSNSFRVIKTTKQTAQLSEQGELSYPETVALIVEQDGWLGLFGRGLQTRLATNALQGAAFSVLWKYFQQV